jgi:hypothetical protein
LKFKPYNILYTTCKDFIQASKTRSELLFMHCSYYSDTRGVTGLSTRRGDTVSVSNFDTISGINLGIGNSRGTSSDTVNRGLDSDSLGVCGLSTIGDGGPASCILGSNCGITISSVFSTGARNGDRSLL